MKELEKKIETYSNQLIELGGRNPAIFMGNESKKVIYLSKYDSLIKKKKDEYELKTLKNSEFDVEDIKKIISIIKHIDIEAKKIIQEKGISALNIGSHFIEIVDGKTIFRAPLVLSEVEIDFEDDNEIEIELCEQRFNLNLLYSLVDKFGLTPLKSYDNLECSDENIQKVLNVFPNEFNIILDNKLERTTKAELEKLKEAYNYYPNVETLGIYINNLLPLYEQTKKVAHYISEDQENLIYKTFISNMDAEEEINCALKSEVYDEELKSYINEGKIFNLTNLDYSQARIVQVAKTSDLVIQGPPGTGKTETILNIISDMVLNQKKVLVVSEKKAALDVLHTRILRESEALGKVSLYIKGSDSSSKKVIIDQIKEVFSESYTGEKRNFITSVGFPKLSTEYNMDSIKRVMRFKNSKAPENHDEYCNVVSANHFESLDNHKLNSDNYHVGKSFNYIDPIIFDHYKHYASIDGRNHSAKEISLFLNKDKIDKMEFGFFEKLFAKKSVISQATWNQNLDVVRNYAKALDYANNNVNLLDYDNSFFNNSKYFEEEKQFYVTNSEDIEKIKEFSNDLKEANTKNIENVKVTHKMNHHAIRKNSLAYGGTELYRIRTNKASFRKSIRTLISDNVEQFQDSFPVILSTPINLASVLDLNDFYKHFDYIIFDEASQISPEYAIFPLALAKNTIIVGDDKQLRPSKFFSSTLSSEEDLEIMESEENNESLLDIVNRTFGDAKRKMLKYHYRSEHANLIRFSNAKFYNNELVSLTNNKYSDEPFEIVNVDNGIWDKSVNLVEAKEVVETLYNLRKRYPQKSIGIITVNQPQMDAIEDAIELRQDTDADFRNLFGKEFVISDTAPYTFVKNIENVQGDERDIIIFSLGYSYNTKGVVTANYGAINRQAGENRLNVAFTRAKYKFVLVKSLNSGDLKVTDKVGTKILKEFIEYVEHNISGDHVSISHIVSHKSQSDHVNIFDSPFEEEVYIKLDNELSKMGNYKLITQYNTHGYRIDMVVVDAKDKPLLAIECDGASFHSSIDAKERDYYRQKYLEARGWEFIRIWSTDWFRDNENEVQQVIKKVKSII